MRHYSKERKRDFLRLVKKPEQLDPAQKQLRLLLNVLTCVFFFATLLYGLGPFIGPFKEFFKQLPFVSNSVVKVYTLMLICMYAAGDVRTRRNLLPVFIGAHALSIIAMLVFLFRLDTSASVPLGKWTSTLGAILWGAIALDFVLATIVGIFYFRTRRSTPMPEPKATLTGAETWLRRVLLALGVVFGIAALGYELGALLPASRSFFIELPFVSNSAVKVGLFALLCLYVAKDLRANVSITNLVIFGHVVSALVLLVFMLFKSTHVPVTIGAFTLSLHAIMLGALALDLVIVVMLIYLYRAALARRYDLKFLGGIEYRTLIALADVLVHGENEHVQPEEIAANLDYYVSKIRARRRWVYRAVLVLLYFHPRLYFKAPLAELDAELRLRHLKKHFYPDGEIRLLPKVLQQFVSQMIRIAKQLTYVGYYNDERTFADVGYVPFSQRSRSQRMTLPQPAIHPLKVVPSHEVRLETLDTDVCIIGSGVAGALLTYDLAKAGREVLLLERGKYVEPRYFSENEADMVGKLYADGIFQQTQDFGFTILQGSCVGGGSVVNNAVSFSPPDAVLQKWNDADIHDAGLDLGALKQSDAEVRKFLGIIRQNDREHGCMQLNPSGKQFVEGARKLDPSGQRLIVDVVEANLRDCLGCGYCNIGCAFGRKLSMLEVTLPRAQREFKDRVKIMSECEVLRLREHEGRITEVEAQRPDGTKLKIRAKTFVVAAGAIASSYLLMRSKLGKNLPVGKNLCFNMGSYLTAEFEDALHAYDGLQISHYGIPNPWAGFVFETWWNPPVVQALNMPGWFEDHFENMRRYDHMMAVGVLVGTKGNAEVKRALTGGADIKYVPDSEDLGTLAEGLKMLGELLFKAGAKRVMANTAGYEVFTQPEDLAQLDKITRDPSYVTLGTGHPQGGNGMSRDPQRGVVDPNFRVHGYDNLYVCDASVFPSSTTVNPQLTVMALAHYAASRIK